MSRTEVSENPYYIENCNATHTHIVQTHECLCVYACTYMYVYVHFSVYMYNIPICTFVCAIILIQFIVSVNKLIAIQDSSTYKCL